MVQKTKRKREEDNTNNENPEKINNRNMDIVWQTPANPPHKEDYIFRNGRRHVRPYYFEFISHVKNRWAGKTIVDLFAEEFKGRPYDYYVGAVKCGRIQVDGELVPVSYIVKSSQKISHFLHRHEPPVMAWDVSILQKEVDVVTVCKPASVPVHPCGQYRKNTVVGILQAEYDLAPLFPVHRLDRLVSGLLILARSASRADVFRQEIEAGKVQKQYIAKVIGVFPEDEQIVDANVNYNAREGKSTVEVGDPHDDRPAKGKSACTVFTRVCTNGTHSIVLCKPITGRTHQIRVHLKYTGHAIANDFLYLSEQVIDRSTGRLSADRAAHPESDIPNKNSNGCEENFEEDFEIDPMCTNCPNLSPNGYDWHEEGLWLHCVKYSGPGWIYECPYPDWNERSGYKAGRQILGHQGWSHHVMGVYHCHANVCSAFGFVRNKSLAGDQIRIPKRRCRKRQYYRQLYSRLTVEFRCPQSSLAAPCFSFAVSFS